MIVRKNMAELPKNSDLFAKYVKKFTEQEDQVETTRKQIADSFVQCGGVQCGFCIPGMAMRGHATVCENANPSREQIAFDLRGNLCRCMAYVRIRKAIKLAAARKREGGGAGHD